MNRLIEFIKTLPIKQMLDQLDVVSGAVLFIVTTNVLGMAWWGLLHGKGLDGGIITWSLGVLAAKTTHGIMTQGNDKDNGNPPPPVQP